MFEDIPYIDITDTLRILGKISAWGIVYCSMRLLSVHLNWLFSNPKETNVLSAYLLDSHRPRPSTSDIGAVHSLTSGSKSFSFRSTSITKITDFTNFYLI